MRYGFLQVAVYSTVHNTVYSAAQYIVHIVDF